MLARWNPEGEVCEVPKLYTESPVRLKQELEAAAFNLGGCVHI